MAERLGRKALNAVRISSDSTPHAIITASKDDGLAAAISFEMEQIDGSSARRITASFFWDDVLRFAEALMIIVKDAQEADQARTAAALRAIAEEADDE